VKTWSPASGGGNGFAFEQHDAAGLTWGVEAALATFRDRAAWARLMKNGMAEDFSWSTQARLYEQVYQRLGASA
jgi:starch synthase